MEVRLGEGVGISEKLIEHAHNIGELNRRMGGFETELKSVQSDLHKGFANADRNFAALQRSIETNQAKQGPGAQEWLKIALWGGGLVGM
jgi:hypothetical protein